MKKLIIAILLLGLAATPALAASNIDLSTMTDNELRQLNADIIQTLISRQAIEPFLVPVGEYVVGVDLPAGVYTVTPAQEYLSAALSIFQSQYDMKVVTNQIKSDDYFASYGRSKIYIVSSVSPVANAAFIDGYIVTVQGGGVLLSPYTDLTINYK